MARARASKRRRFSTLRQFFCLTLADPFFRPPSMGAAASSRSSRTRKACPQGFLDDGERGGVLEHSGPSSAQASPAARSWAFRLWKFALSFPIAGFSSWRPIHIRLRRKNSLQIVARQAHALKFPAKDKCGDTVLRAVAHVGGSGEVAEIRVRK